MTLIPSLKGKLRAHNKTYYMSLDDLIAAIMSRRIQVRAWRSDTIAESTPLFY